MYDSIFRAIPPTSGALRTQVSVYATAALTISRLESLPRLCSLLGVAIELPEFPLSFGVAIRRMGGFVLVVLAHSMQSPFYSGCSRSMGLRMEQLRELE